MHARYEAAIAEHEHVIMPSASDPANGSHVERHGEGERTPRSFARGVKTVHAQRKVEIELG
jgi:hypothetical protein